MKWYRILRYPPDNTLAAPVKKSRYFGKSFRLLFIILIFVIIRRISVRVAVRRWISVLHQYFVAHRAAEQLVEKNYPAKENNGKTKPNPKIAKDKFKDCHR